MKKVEITVEGGIASVTGMDEDIEVVIRDIDLDHGGEDFDVLETTWRTKQGIPSVVNTDDYDLEEEAL